ncbi:hypothetical protein QQS21_005390 [Conoideocrella luteorostrata]|uniref:Uncharacterized protein n=1 Tax=Conoideocrella luteorostrata TaxID=1105319 RepID=A0AAJ0CSJ8_9HYPO|nr:hypothetical protein QQS21_005390 [Conoideocrella luteorostrata]
MASLSRSRGLDDSGPLWNAAWRASPYGPPCVLDRREADVYILLRRKGQTCEFKSGGDSRPLMPDDVPKSFPVAIQVTAGDLAPQQQENTTDSEKAEKSEDNAVIQLKTDRC